MKFFKKVALFAVAVVIFAVALNLGFRIVNNVRVVASAKAAEAKVQEVMNDIVRKPNYHFDESICRVPVCLDQYPTREGEECIYGFDSLWQAIRYTEFIEAFLISVDGHQEELGIDWATKTNYDVNYNEFMEAYCDLMWKAIGEGKVGEIRNTASLRAKMSRYSLDIVRRASR